MNLHYQAYIDLYFGDESHFGLTPNVPYAWQHKENPILLPCKKSQKLSVFGLMRADGKLDFHTTTGSMNSVELITDMDHFCQTIKKKTVIVLDNAPIHRSKLFKSKIKKWEEEDLYIFFLSPYSPELNKIEILWRFIKYKWLPFDAFLNFQNLKERLNEVLSAVNEKYVINAY
ncbi:hypothetical protein EZS27_028262 [termite gut metagenome]|uniref:Tc1-like transposase DDE domain-containing protein n=1 Tax=termite gut metagenome TaxID=433724 RepID=A0A5J4QJN6_9ZZZZ